MSSRRWVSYATGERVAGPQVAASDDPLIAMVRTWASRGGQTRTGLLRRRAAGQRRHIRHQGGQPGRTIRDRRGTQRKHNGKMLYSIYASKAKRDSDSRRRLELSARLEALRARPAQPRAGGHLGGSVVSIP